MDRTRSTVADHIHPTRSLRSVGSSGRLRVTLLVVLACLLLRSLFPVVGLEEVLSTQRDEWNAIPRPLSDNAALQDPAGDHLLNQARVQQDMQSAIYKNQHPVDCDTARLLLRGGGLKLAKDGFASEIQYVARLLQMGLATGRSLVLTLDWRSAYEPADCQSNTTPSLQKNTTHSSRRSGWPCLWKPLTSCSVTEPLNEQDAVVPFTRSDFDVSAAQHGILPGRTTSKYFDTTYYGPTRIAWAPNAFTGRPTLLADVLSHWERAHGRFWVRAQIAHYLWHPSDWMQQAIDARSPRELVSGTSEPFIGFHVRKTDNIADFSKAFGRNATQTRSFERFMAFAEHIRELFPDKKVRKIFLATDNSDVVAESKRKKWQRAGWKFVFQTDVQRTTQKDRMWFRNGRDTAASAIATDLHVLRQADFLVGSFQSNVYRLAAELNTAWHTTNYSWSLHRHWTVDVEWYEDP